MKILARVLAVVGAALFLAAPAVAGKVVKGSDPMQASSWEIGPIINGESRSPGMPSAPSPHPDGWYFDFPQPDRAAGHVHYVTFKHGSLSGKSRIILRYRIEAAPDVQFIPQEYPTAPATLTLYFQRRGDNWSIKYEAYRWWATFRVHMPLTPGEHELSVGLDENWTSTMGTSATSNPRGFRDAIREAERVGFTFGGGGAAGHGVYATGPARFVLTGFAVVSSDTDFAVRSAPADND